MSSYSCNQIDNFEITSEYEILQTIRRTMRSEQYTTKTDASEPCLYTKSIVVDMHKSLIALVCSWRIAEGCDSTDLRPNTFRSSAATRICLSSDIPHWTFKSIWRPLLIEIGKNDKRGQLKKQYCIFWKYKMGKNGDNLVCMQHNPKKRWVID